MGGAFGDRREVDGTAPPPPARRLTLLSPADGLEVVYDTDLPPERQKVLLRALPAAADGGPLWWFVDGTPAGRSQGDVPGLLAVGAGAARGARGGRGGTLGDGGAARAVTTSPAGPRPHA